MSRMYIYGLKSSASDDIMYVGMSKNPAERFMLHLAERREMGSKKERWLWDVLSAGQTVDMVIIDVADMDVAQSMEAFWIDYFRCINPNLTNTIYPKCRIKVHNGRVFDIARAVVIRQEIFIAASEYFVGLGNPVMQSHKRNSSKSGEFMCISAIPIRSQESGYTTIDQLANAIISGEARVTKS